MIFPGLKDTIRGILPRARQPEPEKPTYEQMKEVIELADEFDKLQHLPVWEKILRFLGSQVNSALLDQSKCLFDAEQGRVRHLIWNSKRGLLDDMLGWIDSTQAERDRIIGEFKEMQHGR
jgi:hypothetical protein